MKTVWTDRSRVETYQRCTRLRYLEYSEAGTGIVPAKKSLALCVGGSVHKGLETLLIAYSTTNVDDINVSLPGIEDTAVEAALADFATHRSALALDLAEESALATPATDLTSQLLDTAASLGIDPNDASMAELFQRQRNAGKEFEEWLYREQSALVEGMVRAWARRRLLKPLLEEFEVLEVEREGDWELARWRKDGLSGRFYDNDMDYELRFMSRPDALLRSRADNSLYILSFKTAASWDVRKARDAEHDMQGLSEGVEIEKRLGERIMGIRYEYMLKGARYADKDLSSRFGLNVWAQRSHLIRAYHNAASGEWCWSYDFVKDDGGTSKLYYKNWRPAAVWEHMSVKAWVDMLDASTETMSGYDSTVGQEPRLLGYKSPAQAQGYTLTHPLDDVFPSPLTVYRQEDAARDWIEQVEAQETRVAEAVAQVDAAGDEGEKRHLLNVLFPMHRRSCSYPSECAMTKICFGGDDIRLRPLESGHFKARVPNHPVEATR
jgi:hypothetical protein